MKSTQLTFEVNVNLGNRRPSRGQDVSKHRGVFSPSHIAPDSATVLIPTNQMASGLTTIQVTFATGREADAQTYYSEIESDDPEEWAAISGTH